MNNPLRHRQCDPGALELVGPVQPLKNPRQFIRILHVEARAIVAHETITVKAFPSNRQR
jgi:hypothetical protein